MTTETKPIEPRPSRYFRPMASCDVCEIGYVPWNHRGAPRICPRCMRWIDRQRTILGIP